MSNKLPFTATIFCVPSKIKDADGKPYPGGYLPGWLEDARWRLFHGQPVPILHMPGGWANHYNNGQNWGYGYMDKKADIDPGTRPDFCFDCRKIADHFVQNVGNTHCAFYPDGFEGVPIGHWPLFDAVIIDRDYNREFADKHATGSETWPSDKEIEQVGRDCFDTVLGDDGLVIFFDHKGLGLGKGYTQVWHVTVEVSGRRQYPRVYTVWCKDMDRKAWYPDMRSFKK